MILVDSILHFLVEKEVSRQRAPWPQDPHDYHRQNVERELLEMLPTLRRIIAGERVQLDEATAQKARAWGLVFYLCGWVALDGAREAVRHAEIGLLGAPEIQVAQLHQRVADEAISAARSHLRVAGIREAIDSNVSSRELSQIRNRVLSLLTSQGYRSIERERALNLVERLLYRAAFHLARAAA